MICKFCKEPIIVSKAESWGSNNLEDWHLECDFKNNEKDIFKKQGKEAGDMVSNETEIDSDIS